MGGVWGKYSFGHYIVIFDGTEDRLREGVWLGQWDMR